MAQEVPEHHETDTAQQSSSTADSSGVHEEKTSCEEHTDRDIKRKDVKDDLLSVTAAGVDSTVQQPGIAGVHLASASFNQARGPHQGEVTAPIDLAQPPTESPGLVTNDQTRPTSNDQQGDHKEMRASSSRRKSDSPSEDSGKPTIGWRTPALIIGCYTGGL